MAADTWAYIAQTLELLARVLFVRPDGVTTPQAPAAIPPDVSRAADAWLRHWLRTSELLPLTDELRFALLPRATYATTVAQMTAQLGMPLPEPDRKSAMEALLIHVWHSQAYAQWLAGETDPRRFDHN